MSSKGAWPAPQLHWSWPLHPSGPAAVAAAAAAGANFCTTTSPALLQAQAQPASASGISSDSGCRVGTPPPCLAASGHAAAGDAWDALKALAAAATAEGSQTGIPGRPSCDIQPCKRLRVSFAPVAGSQQQQQQQQQPLSQRQQQAATAAASWQPIGRVVPVQQAGQQAPGLPQTQPPPAPISAPPTEAESAERERAVAMIALLWLLQRKGAAEVAGMLQERGILALARLLLTPGGYAAVSAATRQGATPDSPRADVSTKPPAASQPALPTACLLPQVALRPPAPLPATLHLSSGGGWEVIQEIVGRLAGSRT